ncbi:hypothetical protein N7451_000633 [Penicillium sp. IBT 35674x]|nr:hypothetical protein N7451_000633 [Penicillium sp. IBT 35674x]
MARAGVICWCCDQPKPDICHVFAKEDIQLEVWQRAGLINFDLRGAANAIPLCKSCHGQFDSAIDPGYVFFPSDIQYFIDCELADRQQREQALREGIVLERCVPTNLEYQWHQQQAGLIPEDNRGGLYRRVFLSPFLLGGWSEESWLDHFGTDKQWHGAPMASFRRAFAILGSVRVYVIDKSIRDQLNRLRDLYFDDEGIISVALRKQYTLLKRPYSDPEEDPSRSPKRQRPNTSDPNDMDDIEGETFPLSKKCVQSTSIIARKASFATLQAMDVVPQLSLCIEWLGGLSAAPDENKRPFESPKMKA